MNQAEQNKKRLEDGEHFFTVSNEAIEDAVYIARTMDSKAHKFMWEDGSVSVCINPESKMVIGVNADNYPDMVDIETADAIDRRNTYSF